MSEQMEYGYFLEIVADNPHSTADELAEIAVEHGMTERKANKHLLSGVDAGDIIEVDNKHWIVRKGEFAFSERDYSTE